jgi:sulfur carrier protein ThiS
MQVILPDKTIIMRSDDPVPIERILLDMGIVPSGVIVLRNGRVVPDDVIATADDQIRIIRIAHGG